MAITLGLVIAVIFLFLRNASATLIPSMALPFSILGTFAVMYLLNYSLDNISMMALILCIGFVVDDAIVMLENIVRHMEKGETAFQAALRGSREIGFTIVSMTISLGAVFIPVLFMGGIIGRLFKEFAVTLCTAIFISGLVSITLTPMLCSRFLKDPRQQRQSWFNRNMEGFFNCLLNGYKRSLRVVLKHHYVMAAVFFILIGATIYLFGAVSKGFIPDEDNDSMMVTLEAAQGTSYYKMVDYVQRVSAILRAGSEYRLVHGAGRHHQYAALLDAVEAAQNAGVVADPGHRRAAPQAVGISGRKGVSGGSAQPALRRPSDQVGLRFHAARARHRRALHASAEAAARDRKAAGLDRRDHGFAGEESASEPGHRPGSRGRARPGRQSDRIGAVQRVWPALVVHHLRAHQSIQGAAGGFAQIPGVLRLSVQAFLQNSGRPTGAAQ